MHAFLLAVTLAAASGGAGKTAQAAAKHIDIDDDEVVVDVDVLGRGLRRFSGAAARRRQRHREEKCVHGHLQRMPTHEGARSIYGVTAANRRASSSASVAPWLTVLPSPAQSRS